MIYLVLNTYMVQGFREFGKLRLIGADSYEMLGYNIPAAKAQRIIAKRIAFTGRKKSYRNRCNTSRIERNALMTNILVLITKRIGIIVI